MQSQSIMIRRKRQITTEIFDDGTIGLEIEKDNSKEPQYLYFTMTDAEILCFADFLLETLEKRKEYLEDKREMANA